MLGNGRPFVLEVINPRLGHPAEEVLQQVEQALAASCV
jgi:tRNA U54 and U55 pseudouridine synthase Pus10